ncbi:MAG TPA: DNA polymerase III subunit gamma/tau [Terriglobales bacterium]|nr:DNA polymerase III subunit gamma/tau [Terriglobales bacterium]
MSYQVLARKYRPQRFSEVIGQDHVTRTLKHAIEQGRVAHGYIFSGHRGIGKTTIARILAMSLNCRSSEKPVAEPCGVCDSCQEIRAGNSVDVIEIDAATNRGIDEIRELRDAARYRPARDRFKIWILDEAHQITDAAFNALLKTLEEPPGHVIFMMATTQPEDIPQTIRSRCQHFSFHAVKFDEIVGQLRDIAGKEKIKADDDALAMLAEAGDGSMRDALSIMDQAIACCGTTLTAGLVRDLVGAVPAEVLEQMMQAVARNSSEEVLRLVDKLVTEGQNPAHFARQMVRFLRNTTVAKIAGQDSPLLQISSDERARVGRVAELFSEEDLARFLQILLRTHSELGYRQEQRFHLELGLLKMVHAQRLLPIEEILSGATTATERRSSEARPAVASPFVPAKGMGAQPGAAAPPRPSPFEADRARKEGTRKPEMSVETQPYSRAATAVAIAGEPAPQAMPAPLPAAGDIREAVLAALENARQQSVVSMLSAGEWSTQGGEVVVQVAAGAKFVEMAMNAEARRVANEAASAAAARPVRLRVAPGQAVAEAAPARPANGGPGARARAADDPVVRRMQEKFGAEIRTVIDHRDKGR